MQRRDDTRRVCVYADLMALVEGRMTVCAGGQPEGKIYLGVGSHRISRLRSLHLDCEIIFSCWLRVSMGYRVRRHGSKFTTRVPSSVGPIPFLRRRHRSSHFMLFDFTHSSVRQAQTFSGEYAPAEGELSGVAGSSNAIHHTGICRE